MDRTERCELVARLSDSEITEMRNLVIAGLEDDVAVIVEPTIGMVMARAVDGAHGQTFNLGEVLVTECQVRIGDQEGWSMLMGSRPRAALAAATIDAAVAAGRAPVVEIDHLISRFIAIQDADIAAQRAELAATRVQVETQ